MAGALLRRGRSLRSAALRDSDTETEGEESHSGACSSRSSKARSPAASTTTAKRSGPIRLIKETYLELVDAVVRPPRAEYQDRDLGPPRFQLSGSSAHETSSSSSLRRTFVREDLQLENAKGLTLECSWWQPAPETTPAGKTLPCVVYMHGNSSCRLEALEYIPMLMKLGVTLLAFDFAGCGRSQGDFITLGHHEKDDVKCVIDHLRRCGRTSTIALWGRSMGAATALMHGHRDPSIAAMILDSPFSDLHALAREFASRLPMRYKPRALVNCILRMIRSSVRSRSGMDMFRLKPIEFAESTFIPAMFVAGADDSFILPSHAGDIHSRYAGDKNIVIVEGDHNTRRPSYLQDSVSIFLRDRLLSPAEGSASPAGSRDAPTARISQMLAQGLASPRGPPSRAASASPRAASAASASPRAQGEAGQSETAPLCDYGL